eukprot:TRINITY_DN7368_c0_g2_i1.p1 TRINITY_DN7368_c0_g2~~TRINITY_DN7368_c0_g2_i1.p1  ORF type:complete len:140 (-),score=32.21 TRINITY_DN7368_c0_g2_i1:3-371(-)
MTGYQLFASSVRLGPTATSATFQPAMPLQITFTFQKFIGQEQIVVAPILTLQAFATQALSLSTSLIGAGGIILLVLEKVVEWTQRILSRYAGKKQRPPQQSNKSSTASSTTQQRLLEELDEF